MDDAKLDEAVLHLVLGALAPSLRSQFEALGIMATDKQLTRWQSQADATVQLYLGNLLTDAEMLKCRKRIMKEIVADLSSSRVGLPKES